MRVLVTGGAGFIGSHVVAAIAAAGHEVAALDSLHPAAHRDRAPFDGDVRIGDIRDAGTVAEAVHGVDAVAHHAAMVGMGGDIAAPPEYVPCNDLLTPVLLAGL